MAKRKKPGKREKAGAQTTPLDALTRHGKILKSPIKKLNNFQFSS